VECLDVESLEVVEEESEESLIRALLGSENIKLLYFLARFSSLVGRGVGLLSGNMALDSSMGESMVIPLMFVSKYPRLE
jgi:hypothetical protein